MNNNYGFIRLTFAAVNIYVNRYVAKVESIADLGVLYAEPSSSQESIPGVRPVRDYFSLLN